MALETYREKRNFRKTPEPKGRRTKSASGRSFVVQKHAARRLHYDFRIEVDGVLKSWAVTRGPSLVPGEKRLAVHVEDHPLDYGDFEGTIPKGEYGGGTVLVWDRGTWQPIGDIDKGYKKGHLEFELDGEKLHGRWHLIRMAPKPRERRENWLLIKGDDEYARTPDDPDILEERPESAKTGRLIEEVEGEEPGWSSKTGKIEKKKQKPDGDAVKQTVSPIEGLSGIRGVHKARMPDFIEPTLATLKPKAPAGARWVHEIKFDGYRLQARISGGKVKLLTRSGLDWTGKFGEEVPAALGALPAREAIIDGELVVEMSGGASDFSALQADLSEGRSDRFVFYVFDLLHLDGYDLRGAKLTDRKAALQQVVQGAPVELRYSDHFEEDGEVVLRHACRLSLEGVVSKLAAGKYQSGRTKDWIKIKCTKSQEFVIGGYVPSTTGRDAIGSLVLGYYEGKRLVHAGRVGTGFSNAVARDLFKRLNAIRQDKSPFADPLNAEARRNVRYVEPKLAAAVEFRAWTGDGLVRHASFQGLREDKEPTEIVRESGTTTEIPARESYHVKLTHPDRVYWPEAGVTKEGLADYYQQVWRYMAPHVVSRPLALVRCPDGYNSQCFFQKHEWKGMSAEILRGHDPEDKSGEPIIAVDSLDGLIGLVQGASLEIHPWQSSLDDLERPDQIVMDLDPGEDVAWDEVITAAREVRERLEAAGLAAFVKTTGGKGLHVVTPLKPKAGWDEVKGFAKGIADSMASDAPDRFIAIVTKSKRRGKILVDYLRNGRGATAVAPYSTRARAGAPVAMPLGWEELNPAIGPSYFTVGNALTRLQHLTADPWEDFRKAALPLDAKVEPGAGGKPRRSRRGKA
jgi:bifunctional non-homologous end joining protein LigD